MSADALMTLKEPADALGGEVVGDRVLCPGPNHSGADRSLSVWPANNAAGFTVHSFAGDTRQECIAHVKAMLDSERRAALAKLGAALPAREARAEDPRKLANKKRALEIWAEAEGPIGTLAERYLWGERSLDLARELAGDVLRFHKACPWTDEATDKTIYVPAMLAAMRDIRTDKVVAIHRTRLSPVGQKLGRKMLGPAAGAAVKIDEDANVTIGLTIGEGIESLPRRARPRLRASMGARQHGRHQEFSGFGRRRRSDDYGRERREQGEREGRRRLLRPLA